MIDEKLKEIIANTNTEELTEQLKKIVISEESNSKNTNIAKYNFTKYNAKDFSKKELFRIVYQLQNEIERLEKELLEKENE